MIMLPVQELNDCSICKKTDNASVHRMEPCAAVAESMLNSAFLLAEAESLQTDKVRRFRLAAYGDKRTVCRTFKSK